jgi:dipeptidyl aminopeptidase/acylaminoacyl peptidase
MQDDLDDGMDWLTGQGVVDAKRVCVVGSSYGGYAALWAATRNPERYRCAASFAGISDVPKWLKYSGRFDGSKHRENWRARLQGDKTFDLKTVSPLYTIDRLNVPVMIVHGEADTRVPFKQSKQYADALTTAGKVHEFYAIPEEGHGFTTAANEQLWLDKLDAFLAKYNPTE